MVEDTGSASAPASPTPAPTVAGEPDVLVTKVTTPPARPTLLPRERLLTTLDQCRSFPLTLLSASAGFGKTTLLSAWASQCTTSQSAQIAWLALDEQDNDPTRFWTYVVAALRRSSPNLSAVGAAALAHLHASRTSELGGALTALINELAARSKDSDTVLILHDYHLLSEPAIHDSVQYLLDHCPAFLHVLIATRDDPPLALARLRARGQVVEIREPELRLNDEEAERFLTQVMGLALSADAAQRLQARTEGWIAGLQLAALALRRHADDVSAFIQAFGGSQRFILDYVQGEILGPLPERQQRFLLQTAVLEQMNAQVCQALTEEPASQQMLEALERAHLFVVSLDEDRHWYRYHALFREVLLARLQATQPQQVRALHRRAAAWYAAHDSLHEAIPHALAAEDYEAAADLLERYIVPQHWRNEYHLLRRWAGRLPEAVLAARPDLCVQYVSAVVLTSRRGPKSLERVDAPLRLAEQGFRARNNQTGLGTVLVMRAVLTAQQGAFAQAFDLARQALDVLPEDNTQWRSHALCLAGTEEALAGELTRAEALLRQGLALYERLETLPGRQYALAHLGDVCLERGEPHLAASYLRQAMNLSNEQRTLAQLQLTLETGERETYYERMARYGMAQLAYEWNDLDAAERLLGEALAGPAEWRHLLTGGVLLQVRLLLARDAAEQAREALAEQAVQAAQPDAVREIQMCRAYLALATGDLASAQRWVGSMSTSARPQSALLALTRREEEALLLARVRLAEGRAGEALDVLAHWRQQARTAERRRSAVQILVLEAQAYQASGTPQRGKEMLLQALTLAQPAGYQRLFLDEGMALVALMKALVPDLRDGSQTAALAYARTLLRASTPGNVAAPPTKSIQDTVHVAAPVPAHDDSILLAPLTAQERRVLHLLAGGASNQEIATQLVVSLATAKKHVASILSKLGAENRTQAVAHARALTLL